MILTIFILITSLTILIYFYKKLTDLKNRILIENEDLKQKCAFIDDMEAQQKKFDAVKASCNEQEQLLKEIQEKIDLYINEEKYIDCGIHEQVYNLVSSLEYKRRLESNKQAQKLICDNDAVICKTDFILQGSLSEGQKMIEKEKRLLLRAFNAVCDKEFINVRWNNLGLIEKRISKAYTDINKIGAFHDLTINERYLKLKKEELTLIYEYQQKLYQEREEQKERREQMREEQKLLEEAEKARKKREEEEKQRAELERIRQEAYEAGQLDKAKECEQLIAEKDVVIEGLQRTESNAEKGIKRGHIYIISNVGSFGENVYKIGMTRRDNPEDRVDELGNASVPFNFYIHGLIPSENAPELEKQLHQAFNLKRVNRINNRKEFFKTDLQEIEQKVFEITGESYVFSRQIDTQDYLQTLEIIKKEIQPQLI